MAGGGDVYMFSTWWLSASPFPRLFIAVSVICFSCFFLFFFVFLYYSPVLQKRVCIGGHFCSCTFFSPELLERARAGCFVGLDILEEAGRAGGNGLLHWLSYASFPPAMGAG